jgi:hypothetical protein
MGIADFLLLYVYNGIDYSLHNGQRQACGAACYNFLTFKVRVIASEAKQSPGYEEIASGERYRPRNDMKKESSSMLTIEIVYCAV